MKSRTIAMKDPTPSGSGPRKRIRNSRLADDDILKITPQRRWNEANRKARLAHHALRAALKRGDIKRGPCAECGSLRVDGHHPDHDKPLEVVWLCRKHHRQLHAAERRMAA